MRTQILIGNWSVRSTGQTTWSLSLAFGLEASLVGGQYHRKKKKKKEKRTKVS
jgi:hypothetical protein